MVVEVELKPCVVVVVVMIAYRQERSDDCTDGIDSLCLDELTGLIRWMSDSMEAFVNVDCLINSIEIDHVKIEYLLNDASMTFAMNLESFAATHMNFS